MIRNRECKKITHVQSYSEEIERDRERQRETETETDRDSGTDRDRHRDRHRDIGRQRLTDTEIYRDRDRERQRERGGGGEVQTDTKTQRRKRDRLRVSGETRKDVEHPPPPTFLTFLDYGPFFKFTISFLSLAPILGFYRRFFFCSVQELSTHQSRSFFIGCFTKRMSLANMETGVIVPAPFVTRLKKP